MTNQRLMTSGCELTAEALKELELIRHLLATLTEFIVAEARRGELNPKARDLMGETLDWVRELK